MRWTLDIIFEREALLSEQQPAAAGSKCCVSLLCHKLLVHCVMFLLVLILGTVTIAKDEMCESGEKGNSMVLEKSAQIFSVEGQSCSPYYS